MSKSSLCIVTAALIFTQACSTRTQAPATEAETPVASTEQAAPQEAPVSASIDLASLDLTALDGSPMDAASLDGNAVLFVNVASQCGFTRQYEGLQALYEQRKDDGLVIVGVPCNQFGGQEPGSAEEIQNFCKMNYGVTFPLLEKQEVNGPKRSKLYAGLIADGDDVGWNFEKFLVAPDGRVVNRFKSSTAPGSDELATAIDQALGS